MGKKSKTKNYKDKKKVHVKVKKHHIHKAYIRLTNVFNSDKNIKLLEISSNDNRNNLDNLSSEQIKIKTIIDFYNNEIKKIDDSIVSIDIDPEDIAYKNLCNQGIKRTFNYAKTLNIPLIWLKDYEMKINHNISIDSLMDMKLPNMDTLPDGTSFKDTCQLLNGFQAMYKDVKNIEVVSEVTDFSNSETQNNIEMFKNNL